MKKNFLIKLLYQFLPVFLFSFYFLNIDVLGIGAVNDFNKVIAPGDKDDCVFDENKCEFGGKAERPPRVTGEPTNINKSCYGKPPRIKIDPTSGIKYYSLCLPPNVTESNRGTSSGTRISCQVGGDTGVNGISVSSFIRAQKYGDGSDRWNLFYRNNEELTGSLNWGYIQANCYYCGGDGKGNEATCPGFETSAVTSDCAIPTDTSNSKCTFGGSAGKKNCYDNNSIERTTSGSTTVKHFCRGTTDKTGRDQGDLVLCTKNTGSLTLNSQVFDETNAGGVKTYSLKNSAKNDFGCEYKSVTSSSRCSLENNELATCSFGNSNESLGTNCAIIDETYTRDGKTYYCSPDNKKVECDFAFDYTEVFAFSGSTVGTRVWNSTLRGPNCRNYLPPANLGFESPDQEPLSPSNIIKRVSSFLFYFAIFYFVVLILSNAFAYVRSGEDPAELKKIKESLFNTIAGFLFVLLSGSVIVYLISQIG